MKAIYYSLNHILKNKNVNRFKAVYNYFIWQVIKVFNFFPLQIKISESFVTIADKAMALEGGTKMYTQGMYDFNNMNLVKYFLKTEPAVMFDIGTNIGVYSLIASESEGARVYSFEPHPYTFGILKDQVKLNRRRNIFPVNKAIADADGKVNFSDMAGSSVNSIVDEKSAGQKSIQIEATTVSSFCKQHQLSPDLVKMDIEGFEYEALRGFDDAFNSLKIIIIEISKNQGLINNYLNEAGFAGPFRFDFKRKEFSAGFKSLEDPVFVNKKYMQQLKDKFRFSIHGY